MNVYKLVQNEIVDGTAFRQIVVTALDGDHSVEVANAYSLAKEDDSYGHWMWVEVLNTDSNNKDDANAVLASYEG